MLRSVSSIAFLAALVLSALSLSYGGQGFPEPVSGDGICSIVKTDHSQDARQVRVLRALMRPIAEDNTVIVIPVNAGFLKLALNLRCRLLNLGTTNFLYWALDQRVATFLKRRHLPFYYDPGLFSVSEGTGWSDPRYIRMMSERPRVWWTMAATGFNIMFLDSDVVAFEKPERAFLRRSTDFEAQIDGDLGWDLIRAKSNELQVCAGAFWMRAGEKSKCLMDRLIESYQEHQDSVALAEREGDDPESIPRWDDQIALNSVVHDPEAAVVLNRGVPPGQRLRSDIGSPSLLRVRYVPTAQILSGHLMRQANILGSGYTAGFKVAHKNRTKTFRPVMLHVNGWYFGTKTKCLKENGWWELNRTLHCEHGEGWALQRPGLGKESPREMEERERNRLKIEDSEADRRENERAIEEELQRAGAAGKAKNGFSAEHAEAEGQAQQKDSGELGDSLEWLVEAELQGQEQDTLTGE